MDKGGPEPGGDEARKILVKRGDTKAVIDEAGQPLARAGKSSLRVPAVS